MDRFQSEPITLTNPMLKVWGETPKFYYENPCADCKRDFAELIDVPGYGKVCEACAPAAIAFMAAPEPEVTEAYVGSACCGASIRYEMYSYGVDPDTGYHDDGERIICTACGEETEPLLQPVTPRKPITRQQSELFTAEVA